MPGPTPEVLAIVSAPFEENSYVFYRPDQKACVIFDPGLEPGKIVACIEERSLEPAAILCTHGHSDHIAGNAALKERWPNCPLVIGHGDAPKLTDPRQNLSAGFGMNLISPPADQTVQEGDIYEVAGLRFEVFEAPGHSSGHVIFLHRDSSPMIVFGGDVLFRGSIGRTDFPDGDFEELRAAIHSKLFILPDDTIVYSGHGPATTIGEEKRTNPFVGAPAGYRG